MGRRRFHRSVYLGILKRQRLLCQKCGNQLIQGQIHFDHIRALHRSGDDEPENLRALCISCHKTVTAEQARGRGKVRRIKAQDGLLKPKLSKAARRSAGRQRWSDMP